MWLCSSSTSIIEDRDLSAHLNILTIRSLPKYYPDAVYVDQSLAAGSRRSNLATYSGMADALRKAFATANKVQPALFSANSKGACPTCEVLGVIYTDLQHLDPVAVRCETCEGRCFTDQVLALKLRGKNINDVLNLSVVDALSYFTEKPILATLKALKEVGLGYIALGQRLNTLSGGERQRLKLAGELRSLRKSWFSTSRRPVYTWPTWRTCSRSSTRWSTMEPLWS